MILHFRQTQHMVGRTGVIVDERTCLEIPRLSHLHERSVVDGVLYETDEFKVDLGGGHSAHFPDIDGALSYVRANPLPGDIVAVPPWEISNESACDRDGS
jgi:hypothetical protein